VGIPTFGPNADAAALEGSKGFMKDLCARYRIPTAAYARFREAAAARAYVESRPLPIVVKADGLAAGKGVVIAETREQAIAAIDSMLVGNVFGSAGAEVVIEEFMGGEEVSIFALTDGKTALALASAQDHKRVGDGDTGPNTGGMGAYSPAPAASAAVEESVMARIIRPSVAAMAAEGKPFKGVLYAGIMLTAEGPKLLEYNVRFGDPETQVLCPRLKSDLLPALIACHDGMLDQLDLRWMNEAALTVVMAANGYPGSYAKGSEIRGVAEAGKLPGVTIFHAGTKRDSDGRLLAEGGRVLNVTALGATVAEAQKRAYAAIDRIDWPGGFCRRDIGWRALKARS
jgi:phosphoribosylamine--glycine ligase